MIPMAFMWPLNLPSNWRIFSGTTAWYSLLKEKYLVQPLLTINESLLAAELNEFFAIEDDDDDEEDDDDALSKTPLMTTWRKEYNHEIIGMLLSSVPASYTPKEMIVYDSQDESIREDIFE